MRMSSKVPERIMKMISDGSKNEGKQIHERSEMMRSIDEMIPTVSVK